MLCLIIIVRYYFTFIPHIIYGIENNEAVICCIVSNEEAYLDEWIDYHLGIANVKEIDKLNILEATKLSMKRVIDKFNLQKAQLIIDGNFSLNYKSYKEQSLIKGDDKSLSIAAASIIAKVTRDNLMSKIDEEFPNYNWKKNKGYGTKEHRNALEIYGPCKYHRKSFSPINKM